MGNDVLHLCSMASALPKSLSEVHSSFSDRYSIRYVWSSMSVINEQRLLWVNGDLRLMTIVNFKLIKNLFMFLQHYFMLFL